MALLNNVEYDELLGGLRSMPIRAPVALASAVLLHLAGDMVGLWPLAWVALLPLCFACRGAGPFGAMLLATLCFGVSALSQTFWLLDAEGVSPAAIWLVAGVLPALPFAAIELPICRKLLWPMRPPVLGALAIGFWALLPLPAHMLIPGGGLIDSEIARPTLAKLDLATVAGCLALLGWLAAEIFARRGPRKWIAGLVVAGVLCVVALADRIGVRETPANESTDQVVNVTAIPAGDDVVALADKLATPRGLVVWHAIELKAADRAAWATRAGELAQRRGLVIVLVVYTAESMWGYIFNQESLPATQKHWPRGQEVEPLVLEGPGRLSVYPSLESGAHWSTRWSLDVYVTAEEPLHHAQAHWWLREQRRFALVRASRQVCVWRGGGAIIDGHGHVLASSVDGEPMVLRLPGGQRLGESMGHPRGRFVERILKFAAPVIALMLVVLTPIAWAKRRWRTRAQTPQAIALEEVTDDETNLSREETEKITRSFKRGEAP